MKSPSPSLPLPRSFYNRSPELVARELLGKVLVRSFEGETLSGRITETEAYLGLEDPASHASVGKTERNAVLFGLPGFAYIYFIYGVHFCLNVSCLPDAEPGGVLFRAVSPLQGEPTMRRLRRLSATAKASQIAGGPGRLCQAMAITRPSLNGADFTQASSPLQIVDDGHATPAIRVTPRIGIRHAADRPLRFLADLE